MGPDRDYIFPSAVDTDPDKQPEPAAVYERPVVFTPPDQPRVGPPPPAIAKAIIEVMKVVKPLVKDSQVTDGPRRFRYATTDAFFEALGPLMAGADIDTFLEEGEMIIADKETRDYNGKVKFTTWMSTTYFVSLFHTSGVMWGPFKRTIMVRADGPQSFGMGPSYVEKYFLRSLFKVSTGDEDADAHPKDGLPVDEGKLRDYPPSREDPRERQNAVEGMKEFMRRSKVDYTKITDVTKVREWWAQNLTDIKTAFDGLDGKTPDPLFDVFKEDYLEYARSLSPAPDQGVTSGKREPPHPAEPPPPEPPPQKMVDDDIPF